MTDKTNKIVADETIEHPDLLDLEEEPDISLLYPVVTEPKYDVTVGFEKAARSVLTFFQKETRNRLYFFTNVHRARSAELEEINYIDKLRLNEIDYYIEKLAKYKPE